ncbi:MAG: prohibitin family protein [Chloroflexota bacterium]|jgi:regulator of protease activity HflC (stomatin/prohibitin superfamily)|nr:prohibitin family protein [Anaerolineae bacterium]HMM27883.1 prohibitin family protein [Aggregatilineaceae bacterium]
MINVVFSVLALAGLAIAGFGGFMIVQMLSRNASIRGGVLITVVGLILAIVFFVIGAGVIEVQPNEVAVVFNVLSGDLAETPLGPGLHVIIPGIQEASIYSIAQQEYTMGGTVATGATRGDDAVVALTQDGQRVELDVTVIYRISPSNANVVHRNWQDRYENGLIRPALRNQVRGALTEFRVEQIYGTEHSELEQAVEDGVRNLIEPEGFEVTNVLIRNITFSPEYVASIEQKQVAQQQAQEAEFRVRQREQEAEQARALARGEADAARIRAEGEAAALSLINEQLSQNPLLLQWRYIESLGPNVQMMIIPSNSPFLFDLESLTAQSGTPIPTPAAPGGTD